MDFDPVDEDARENERRMHTALSRAIAKLNLLLNDSERKDILDAVDLLEQSAVGPFEILDPHVPISEQTATQLKAVVRKAEQLAEALDMLPWTYHNRWFEEYRPFVADADQIRALANYIQEILTRTPRRSGGRPRTDTHFDLAISEFTAALRSIHLAATQRSPTRQCTFEEFFEAVLNVLCNDTKHKICSLTAAQKRRQRSKRDKTP